MRAMNFIGHYRRYTVSKRDKDVHIQGTSPEGADWIRYGSIFCKVIIA